VHWWLTSHRARKLWLLAASYFFYGAWDWRFLSLIVGSTALDYVVGLRLEGNDDERSRKRWIALSVVANLGLLGVFKYANFFLDSAIRLANALGFEASPHVLGIVLPVGISFYTFQTMSYSLDVYRRELRAVRDPLDFALFVTFFPQLVAGPIVRAIDFLPQLERVRLWRDVRVRACATLFLIGYVKKACIGDNVAELVDPYFKDPALYDALSAWIAVLFYAVQIYCDFSGYSDMAIATAGLFGYELRLNFDFPYFAASIRDFWRRWHMSLSSWLRDYLYIPLGGGRGSRLYQYRNLMLTMLLGGLWHGAGWNFVIWGALHGAALVAHREWERRGLRMPAALGLVATFWWVLLAWIFFRAPSFDGALVTVRSFVLFQAEGARSFGVWPLVTFAALALVHALAARRWIERLTEPLPDWGYALLLGALVPLALAFTNAAVKPFIYFQF
jgi:alginate O-acetyltransferase complex protein AlgI